MSNNKSVVHTTKSVLKSLNLEVKSTEVYETYARLCGFTDWNTANAKGLELSPQVQIKLKEQLMNKIDAMPDTQWQKQILKVFLDDDENAIDDLTAIFNNRPISDQECQEIIQFLLCFKSNLKGFRSVVGELISKHINFATASLKNEDFITTLKENQEKFAAFSEEEEKNKDKKLMRQFERAKSKTGFTQEFKFDGRFEPVTNIEAVFGAKVNFSKLQSLSSEIGSFNDFRFFVISSTDENKRFDIRLLDAPLYNGASSNQIVTVRVSVVSKVAGKTNVTKADIAQLYQAFEMSDIKFNPYFGELS
jgi:hypothetical protein